MLPPKFFVSGISLDVKKLDTDYVATGSGEYYVAPDSTQSPVIWKVYRWNDLTAVSGSAQGVSTTRGGMRTLAMPATTGSALLRAAALADAQVK